jgi:Cu/Ag efflux protein CusF
MNTFMTIHRRSLTVLGLLALLFAGTSSAGARAAEEMDAAGTGDKDVVIAEKTTVTAEVKSIDKAKREVTLQAPDGQIRVIKVPEEARNFDQIQVGDKVTIDYLQAVAVDIKPAGTAKPPSEKAAIEVAPKGEKPSGKMVRTIDLTAKVEAIDPAKRTVTLKGPEGNAQTFTVDPKVELEKIKVGDQVDIRYTEALALKVTPPS